MITLKSLRLLNFRRFFDETITFDSGIIGIVGQNGSGKSTVVDAIGYAMFGAQPILTRTGKDDMKRTDAADTEQWGVEMVFGSGSDEYKIIRMTRGATAKHLDSPPKHKSFVEMECNGSVVAKDDTAVRTKVSEMIGMDFQAFLASVYCRQAEVDTLSAMAPSERKKMMAKMLKIDTLDTAIKSVRQDKRDIDNRVSSMEEAMGTFEELVFAKESLMDSLDTAKAKAAKAVEERDALKQEYDKALAARTGLLSERATLDAKRKEMESSRMAAERMSIIEADMAKLRSEIERDTKAMVAVDEALLAQKEKTSEELDGASKRLAVLKYTAHDLDNKIKNAARLGSECPVCGQDISEGHAAKMTARFEEALGECSEEASEVEARHKELSQMSIRIALEADMASRNQATKSKIEMVQKSLAEKEKELAAVREKKFDSGAWAALNSQLNSIDNRLHAADAESSKIHQRLMESANRVSAACSESSALDARLKEQLRRLAEFTKNQEKMKELAAKSTLLNVADGALADFRMYLIGRVRPMLASFTSDIVSKMTDGRYSRIDISEDYDIEMYDMGVPYPLSRFSGGEQAIVNLAMRLAISQMVGVQMGAEGMGFIILDEVFSSADSQRRETIMATLAGLRNIYSQIVCITHIDAVVDMLPQVIEIERVGTVSRVKKS